MNFATCWLVIPLFGEQCSFTSLGIASGFFWVIGAWAGIYGIQNAGLALSVGIWASLNVVTSCFWGVFVFGEPLKNLYGIVILIVGLIGMSKYASIEHEKKGECDKASTLVDDYLDGHVEKGYMGQDNSHRNKIRANTNVTRRSNGTEIPFLNKQHQSSQQDVLEKQKDLTKQHIVQRLLFTLSRQQRGKKLCLLSCG